jgi:Electron transfer DM13
MKQNMLLAVLIIILAASACKKETFAPDIKLNETVDTSASQVSSGNFMNGPYGNVTGRARIFKTDDGIYQVKLDSFSTNNGPDLHVYLSKEMTPVNFVILDKLKSTMGSQVYNIPGNINLSDYKYVCIHCRQFNHLFGYALIQ